ncbi:uncharacterized protein [Ptychodera flava]|uniref:uncharacterized protein n=1 Tax=Ptychodera flava TaxID=63121 RepID=UPI00396A85F6
MDGDDMDGECSRCCRCHAKLISKLGTCITLTLALLAYIAVGALIFVQLEGTLGKTNEHYNNLDIIVENLTFRLDQECAESRENFTTHVKQALQEARNVFREVDKGPSGIDLWNWQSATLFCVSVVTTIGYGYLAPVTVAGRSVCILYAIVGIPLNLLFLSYAGDVLAVPFRLVVTMSSKCISKTRKELVRRIYCGNVDTGYCPGGATDHGRHEYTNWVLMETGIDRPRHQQRDLKPGGNHEDDQTSVVVSVATETEVIANDDGGRSIRSDANGDDDGDANSDDDGCANHDGDDDGCGDADDDDGGTIDEGDFGDEDVEDGVNPVPTEDKMHILKCKKDEKSKHYRKPSELKATNSDNNVDKLVVKSAAISKDSMESGCHHQTLPITKLKETVINAVEAERRRSGWKRQHIKLLSQEQVQAVDEDFTVPPVAFSICQHSNDRENVPVSRRSSDETKSPTACQIYIEERRSIGIQTNKEEKVPEEKQDKELEVHPAVVGITLLVYVLGGARLFSAFEGWSYFDSVYFCVITITTIGFGDMSVSQDFSSKSRTIGFVVITVFIVLGLVLLSVCFNLTQKKIVEFGKKIRRAICRCSFREESEK